MESIYVYAEINRRLHRCSRIGVNFVCVTAVGGGANLELNATRLRNDLEEQGGFDRAGQLCRINYNNNNDNTKNDKCIQCKN